MVMVPVCVLPALGSKATAIMQFAPAAIVLPRHKSLVNGNSALEEATALIVRLLAPVLVTLKLSGALLTPSACEPKLRLAG